MDNNPKRREHEIEIYTREKSLLKYLMDFNAFIWSSQFAEKQLEVIFQSRQAQSVRRHLETRNAFVNPMTVSHQNRRLLIQYGGLTLCLMKGLFCFNGKCAVRYALRLGTSVLSRRHFFRNSSATCVSTLKGHRDYVLSLAFHPTAPLLATGSWDKTVRLWR